MTDSLITDDYEAREVYNSALIEDFDSNKQIEHKIELFAHTMREKINKKNLINYCGISNIETEIEGCARVNSVYVPKFGKSHIKKTKIINPYGAISKLNRTEMDKIKNQKKKLLEFSSYMNLKEEILKLTNAAPSFKDDQDISDDETAARIENFSHDINDEYETTEPGSKRLRAFVDLAQYSKQYEGKKAKRADLYDDDDDDDEFEDDENGSDVDDDDDDNNEDEEDEDDDEEGEEDESEIEDDEDEDEERPAKKAKKADKSNNEAQKDDDIKLFNSNKEEQKKGKAVKSQLNFWDSLLEHRMKFQNILKSVNEYPSYDELNNFKESLNETSKELHEENETFALNLFNEMIDLNKNFLKLTGNVDVENEEKSKDGKKRKSDKESSNEAKQIKYNDIESCLSQRYTNYINDRNDTLQKWHEKTSLIGSKSLQALEKPILQQLDNLLMDKDRLIKRTQLKRMVYNKLTNNKKQEDEKVDEANLKDYDPEIFDDQDIYQHLLREIISRRSENLTNPLDLSKNSATLQKLKSSKKKVVDTKASKGRKLRFNVHKQLVNFMAPIRISDMSDTARNDLFSALFGAHATFS